jgi:hypothetical protein
MKKANPKNTSIAAAEMARAKHAKLTPEERSEHARKMRAVSVERAQRKDAALLLILAAWERHAPAQWEKFVSPEFVIEFTALLDSGWKPKP